MCADEYPPSQQEEGKHSVNCLKAYFTGVKLEIQIQLYCQIQTKICFFQGKALSCLILTPTLFTSLGKICTHFQLKFGSIVAAIRPEFDIYQINLIGVMYFIKAMISYEEINLCIFISIFDKLFKRLCQITCILNK